MILQRVQGYQSLNTPLKEAEDGMKVVLDVVRRQMGMVMTIHTRLQSISNLGINRSSSIQAQQTTNSGTPNFSYAEKVMISNDFYIFRCPNYTPNLLLIYLHYYLQQV